MTRARKNLYLSFYGIPSRFVSEIPEDCIILAAGDGSVGLDKNSHGANGSRWHDYDDSDGPDDDSDGENYISLD
jgi:hypothetical protein